MIWEPMRDKTVRKLANFERRAMSFYLLIGTLFLVSCGENAGTGDGVIALVVKNAASPAGLTAQTIPTVLQADTFRVTISGSDFSPPIVVTFPGTAAEGEVAGVPVGENRTVLIEAINASGQVVRKRELPGITINGDRPTPIVASLLSIPLVTNVSDGAVVTQTRLIFKGYAEPGSAVEILDIPPAGSESVLSDLSTSKPSMSASLTDGSFTFTPPVLSVGMHTFTIQDTVTGEQTQLQLSVVRPGRQPGIGFQVAGTILPKSVQGISNAGIFSEVVEDMLTVRQVSSVAQSQ